MKISIFILYVCSFVFIYNVPFTGSPLSGSKLMIIFMVAWLIIRSRKIVFTKKLIKIVAWMIVLLFYSLANVFFAEDRWFCTGICRDTFYIESYIRMCIIGKLASDDGQIASERYFAHVSSNLICAVNYHYSIYAYFSL